MKTSTKISRWSFALFFVVSCGDAGDGGGGAGAAGGGGEGGSGGSDACAGVDCNDENLCTQDVCNEDGTCSHPAAVVVTLMQVDGDCAESVCDGTELTTINDSSDVPNDDGDPCTDEVCSGGQPGHPPSADGTPCGLGTCTGGVCGSFTCEADGDCVEGDQDQCLEGLCVDCDDTGGCTAPEVCNLKLNQCE